MLMFIQALLKNNPKLIDDDLREQMATESHMLMFVIHVKMLFKHQKIFGQML